MTVVADKPRLKDDKVVTKPSHMEHQGCLWQLLPKPRKKKIKIRKKEELIILILDYSVTSVIKRFLNLSLIPKGSS